MHTYGNIPKRKKRNNTIAFLIACTIGIIIFGTGDSKNNDTASDTAPSTSAAVEEVSNSENSAFIKTIEEAFAEALANGKKASGTSAKAEKTSGASTKSEKTSDTSAKAEKTSGASTKSEKTSGASTESEKTSGASTKSEKTSGASAKTGKTSGASAKTGKTSGASAKTGKTSGTSAKTEKTSGTSTKAEKASGTSTKTEKKTPPLPSVTITADTIIDTRRIANDFKYLNSKERIYGFKKSAWAGCGLNGTVKPVEMYYGIYAEAAGSELRYRAYSHMENVKPVSATLTRNYSKSCMKLSISENMTEINLGKQANDAFSLTVKFSNGKTCSMTLYVNDGEVWLANSRQTSPESIEKLILGYQKELQELVKSSGITPENSLDATAKAIAYPTYAGRSDNHRCDTDLWRKLAHEIVPDDSLSDGGKLTLLHDWMTANMSYDHYMVDTLKTSRANYYKDWSGKYSVYNLKAGKCADFTTIMVIMARELGIPCSSLETETHTWNIVYLDGQWQEIDLTGDIQRDVNGKDVTEIKNADHTVRYNDFLPERGCGSLESIVSAEKGIYTDKFARTGKY